ncbi:uncharacterized protein LOC126770615 [Nymphalis io]|uniref:uncharacterized protein LOC126770615 n=1 Tax=Inachis io TaxID=171585 RepID=UPI00216AA5E3|nr:uncharacterized protein LOC126770615 [Nymphalis io]XP_050346071.1 uncharacterized protein LOC126770615 [Nymphalis io]
MLFNAPKAENRLVKRDLLNSLLLATRVIENIARDMSSSNSCQWQRTILGHTLTMSRGSCLEACDSGTKNAITAFRSWLQAHEEAQVMIASILVVVGLWWLVRTVLALLINLICPVFVVILAVICIPQLRTPLLGQNYPLLANTLREILLKMADNLKS